MKITIFLGSTMALIHLPRNAALEDLFRSWTNRKMKEWEYHPRYRKWYSFNKFYDMNWKTGYLRVPSGFVSRIRDEVLDDFDVEIEERPMPPADARSIDIEIRDDWPPREDQMNMIDQLCNENSRVALPLQTGKGKTYVSIAAAARMKKAVLILASGLTEQWYKKVLQYTTLEPDEVYVLKGFQSVVSLIDSGWLPPVVIGSMETVRAYVLEQNNYPDLPMSWGEFIEYMGFGVKITDEVHLKYHALTMIDIWSNIIKNIYLSATFTRSDRQSRKIFETVFPKSVMLETPEYDRYAEVWVYWYLGYVRSKTVMRERGYMHARYEGELLKRIYKYNAYMEDVLLKAVDIHYINERAPGEKCLIYFLTTQMADEACKTLRKNHPGLKSVTYTGRDRDKVHEDPEVDILVTTVRKSGVGTDIDNLLTVINTVSTGSQVQTMQILGRLRKRPGKKVIYVDLYDRNIYAHVRHTKVRLPVLESRAAKFTHLPLN